MIKNKQKVIDFRPKNDIIYVDYRCCNCGKMLLKYEQGKNLKGISIKCNRCKTLNEPK